MPASKSSMKHTLAAKLRMRCARQRCRAARGKQISIALMMSAAPSEVTRSGSFQAAPHHVLEKRGHRLGIFFGARHHVQPAHDVPQG